MILYDFFGVKFLASIKYVRKQAPKITRKIIIDRILVNVFDIMRNNTAMIIFYSNNYLYRMRHRNFQSLHKQTRYRKFITYVLCTCVNIQFNHHCFNVEDWVDLLIILVRRFV